MTTWPQIVMLILGTLSFSHSVRADKVKHGLGTSFWMNLFFYAIPTTLLYYGNFWAPLGYPAY